MSYYTYMLYSPPNKKRKINLACIILYYIIFEWSDLYRISVHVISLRWHEMTYFPRWEGRCSPTYSSACLSYVCCALLDGVTPICLSIFLTSFFSTFIYFCFLRAHPFYCRVPTIIFICLSIFTYIYCINTLPCKLPVSYLLFATLSICLPASTIC